MTDDAGFQVTDEIEVGDLSTVQQELVPAAQGVLVAIEKAAIKENKAKDIKVLNCMFRIVEGVPSPEDASILVYQNKTVFNGFMDLCVWADPETRSSQWFKGKQHLLGFKQFCQALDIDLASVRVNDEFLSELIGKTLRVNFVHEADSVKDAEGKNQPTGTFSVRLTGWKAE